MSRSQISAKWARRSSMVFPKIKLSIKKIVCPNITIPKIMIKSLCRNVSHGLRKWRNLAMGNPTVANAPYSADGVKLLGEIPNNRAQMADMDIYGTVNHIAIIAKSK